MGFIVSILKKLLKKNIFFYNCVVEEKKGEHNWRFALYGNNYKDGK